MANRGREYAESLVGPLDRSVYGEQRTVAQNTYDTNWQNVQNQYKNLQDKLKLQQDRSNREFAEGLIDVAENSFNRERMGSANLANRGLSASGLTNMLNQADTAQKGEEIGRLLKNAGAISAGTADKLSQATSKYAQESSGLMGRLADTMADIGDAETAAQNRYNQTLAGIAGAMDQREANNALQAAQRAASGGSSSSRSKVQSDAQNELEEFYKRATINEVLSSPDMTDKQKENYLGIIFGIDNAGKAVTGYNNNINAVDNYNKQLKELQRAADKEIRSNKRDMNNYNSKTNSSAYDNSIVNQQFTSVQPDYSRGFIGGPDLRYNPNLDNSIPAPVLRSVAQDNLANFINSGITYEDLAALLYGNR